MADTIPCDIPDCPNPAAIERLNGMQHLCAEHWATYQDYAGEGADLNPVTQLDQS